MVVVCCCFTLVAVAVPPLSSTFLLIAKAATWPHIQSWNKRRSVTGTSVEYSSHRHEWRVQHWRGPAWHSGWVAGQLGGTNTV